MSKECQHPQFHYSLKCGCFPIIGKDGNPIYKEESLPNKPFDAENEVAKLGAILLFIVGGAFLCAGIFFFISPMIDPQTESMISDNSRPFDMAIIWIMGVAFSCGVGGILIKGGLDAWRYEG